MILQSERFQNLIQMHPDLDALTDKQVLAILDGKPIEINGSEFMYKLSTLKLNIAEFNKFPDEVITIYDDQYFVLSPLNT